MEPEERYQVLQVLKQKERETVSIVKDTQQSGIYLQRVIQDKNSSYLKLQDMQHKNLPRIIAVYAQPERLVVIEQFIMGSNLSNILKDEKSLSEKEVQQISMQLCDVLAYLHGNNIIHRDIKPDNIMLTEDGTIKLIDFDIARSVKESQTSDTAYFGTKGYAPPEQYGFSQTDQRADIYALGKTMETLLGNNYRGQLQFVIRRCTEIDPQKRYKSMGQVKRALKLCKVPMFYQLACWAYKGRVALLIAAIGAGIYLALPSILPAPDEKTVQAGQQAVQQSQVQQESPLELQYYINQSEEEEAGKYYTNGTGDWTFASFSNQEPLDDFGISEFYPDTKYVTYTIPRSHVMMKLCNTGAQTVTNPKIKMVFEGVQMTGNLQEDGFHYDGHVNGIGSYTELIWQPPAGTSIAPGDDQEFTVYMEDSAVIESLEPKVTITLFADNCPAQTFTVPIYLDEIW